MIRSTLALACFALALTACSRDDAPTTAEPAPAATSPATEAPATAAPATPAEATRAAFDVRGYAGTFVSGSDRLELGGDGTYRLVERGSERDGTWTVEQNDTRVRLDPNSKAEADRVFAMDGRDRLTAVDEAGQPAAGAQAWTREASPTP